MTYQRRQDVPEKAKCLLCKTEKAVAEMVLLRLGSGEWYLRPRCKECHNARERGHRREWKTKYLQRWRRHNADLNQEYVRKQNSPENREHRNAVAYRHFKKNHHAILIQGRIRRATGESLPIAECRKLLRKYGRCYPTRFGLTPAGLRECERIRGRNKRAKVRFTPVEIRMMVYEDGVDNWDDCGTDRSTGNRWVIPPAQQPTPYKVAAAKLTRLQAEKKRERAMGAAA